jgi:hypothetical protein
MSVSATILPSPSLAIGCGPFAIEPAHTDPRHAAAGAALAQWLAGTALRWPVPITIALTVAEASPFPADLRESFRQGAVRIQGSAGDPTRVVWDSWPAEALIDPELHRVTLWLSPAALEHLADGERSFLLVIQAFLLRRQGWYHLHGAALRDPQGRDWVVTGNSHSGKSTTTAFLALQGWQIATDDIGYVVLRDGRVELHGSRARIALREGGQTLLGTLAGTPLPARRKAGFWPEELGSRWIPTVSPAIIAFPALGERTTMTRATPRRAIAELVKWSHWMLYEPAFAQEHLDALAALGAQSRCFDLTLAPDLFTTPHLLETLAS